MGLDSIRFIPAMDGFGPHFMTLITGIALYWKGDKFSKDTFSRLMEIHCASSVGMWPRPRGPYSELEEYVEAIVLYRAPDMYIERKQPTPPKFLLKACAGKKLSWMDRFKATCFLSATKYTTPEQFVTALGCRLNADRRLRKIYNTWVATQRSRYPQGFSQLLSKWFSSDHPLVVFTQDIGWEGLDL